MINTNIGYGYNDLCIVPSKITSISSRSECDPFYNNDKLPIFASPMASVVNIANFHLWEREHIIPVLPRNIDYNIRLDYIKQGKWVALSLSEFEELFLNSDELFNSMSVFPHICVDLANGHMKKLIDVCSLVKDKYCGNIVLMTGKIANPATYEEYCKARIDYVMIGGLFASFIESAGEIVEGDHFINLDNTVDYENDIKIINREFDSDYLLNKIIIKGPLSMSDKFDIYKDCEGVETLKVLLGGDLIQYFYIFDIYNPNLHEAIKRSMVDLYKFKKHMYGMSTKTAQRLIKSDNELKTAEGIEKTIDEKYTMKQWVDNMKSYLRSTMSYCDCTKLSQFVGKQNLVVQSPSEIIVVNK